MPPTIRLRLLRLTAPLALAVLCLPLGGCVILAGGTALGATVGAASAPRRVSTLPGPWQPDAAVTVDFARPRDVRAEGAADRLFVADATQLIGRVREVRGDTGFVLVTEIRRAGSGPAAFSRGAEPVVRVVADADVRVTQLSIAKSPRTRAFYGAALGWLLAVVGLILYCSDDGCLN